MAERFDEDELELLDYAKADIEIVEHIVNEIDDEEMEQIM